MAALAMLLRSFHIDHAQDQGLTLLAKKSGKSKSMLVRQGIDRILQEHQL